MPTELRDLHLNEVRAAVGDTPREFARRLGVSMRTVQRWRGHIGFLTDTHKRALAKLVAPYHPEIALQLAAHAGATLESVGIDPMAPGVRACPPPAILVDAVVCAAADAASVTPAAVRATLHAAFTRCREVGLSLQEVEEALRPVAKVRASRPTPPSGA
jgi:Homeodomain-like domain